MSNSIFSGTPDAADLENEDGVENTTPAIDEAAEKKMLLDRARLMGLSVSNNSSLATLRAKIAEKMASTEGSNEPSNEGDDTPEEDEEAIGEIDASELNPLTQATARASAPEAVAAPATQTSPVIQPEAVAAPARPKKKRTLRQYLLQEEMKLVRLRITNLDPKKKDLPGEIITVANDYIGSVKKFVPFGEVTEGGWHVPYCIYRELESRKFLNIRTIRDRRTGQISVETSWAREFALEILPTLTQEELTQLGTAQLAAGSVEA